MTDYAAALAAARPGAEWVLYDNDLSTLVWHDASEMPSQAELDAAWDGLQSQSDARASAVGKLLALGLTEQEALALIGSI